MTLRRRESVTGGLLVLPFLVGFLLFYIIPFFISLWYTVTRSGAFVGLANYREIFTSAAFRLAAGNTFRFIAVAVPCIMAVSFALALMLLRKTAASSFFRSAFLFPLILPIASTVMVFQVFLAESGILNTLLDAAGLPVRSWLSSDSAFGVLVFLYVWKNAGYNIVLFLAGLQTIPKEFYDVANLEGGTPVKSFFRITLPLIVPHIFFVFVISIMNSFKCFREAYLLNGDYPHTSIYMLQHYMNNNFANINYQHLSVAAFLVFLIVFTLIFVLFALRQKAGDYEI